MKVASFKKRVDNLKTSQKSFKNWRYLDRSSSQEKIIGRVSALLHWDMHSHSFDNNDSLIDSAAFVYVIYDKNRFTNFQKAIRDQGLLYETDTIGIEG